MHKSSGVSEANIHRDLFEGLVSENAKGELIPGAAESWTQSEDGKLWTFTLRKDGKWSDGSAVVAQDFVYAMRRAVDPATASEYAFILWPIKNAKAISSGEINDVTKLGIEAVGDHELKIHLENPTPYLPGLLSHHMAYPLHSQSLKKHGKDWTRPGNLVSNGAWQLAGWQPQSHIKLIRNPHFRDAAGIKTDAVIYYPIEDQEAALRRFRAGEIDITYDVPVNKMDWVKQNYADEFRNTPYIGTYYYAMNLQKPPFKGNKALRKALALALRRNILTEKVTKGGEIPALGWVPPGINGYQSQSMQEAALSGKERLALARKLYAEAGYSRENPLEVELLYNTSENHKKIAIAVAAMWKQALGVKVRLRNEEWKVYLSSRSQKQFELVRSGWIGDYNDASSFLGLFRSDVGKMNPSSWSNAKFDDLMQQAEAETDLAKRAGLMQQAESILLDDLPLIPVYFYTTQHLVNTNIKGWEDNVMDIHPSRYLVKTQ